MPTAKKHYTIETAINRLSWRFKNENIKINESKIIINENDIDAVDFLLNWVNNQKSETLQENLLFAKLYCYCLTHEIEFYNDIKFANRKLQEVLSQPINNHYEKVSSTLNRMELNYHLNSLGIITDHIEQSLLKQNQQNQQEQQQKLISDNQQTISKYVIGIWNVDKVYRSLNNTITECINKFKNYK